MLSELHYYIWPAKANYLSNKVISDVLQPMCPSQRPVQEDKQVVMHSPLSIRADWHDMVEVGFQNRCDILWIYSVMVSLVLHCHDLTMLGQSCAALLSCLPHNEQPSCFGRTTSLEHVDRGSLHVAEHHNDLFSWKKYNTSCIAGNRSWL